jgi:uncharacterized membrane protein
MKAQVKTVVRSSVALTITGLCITGCSNGRNIGVTNMEQPGPVIGRAVGGGVGAVAGNVAGAGVGAGEGFGAAVHSTFDNTQRVVRYWKEEKTPDGRLILVPENFLVDQDGRVIRRVP